MFPTTTPSSEKKGLWLLTNAPPPPGKEPLFVPSWIPEFNAAIYRTLKEEQEYHWRIDRYHMKAGKFYIDFPIYYSPEDIEELPDGRFQHNRTAKKQAIEWMTENQHLVYIEWWGDATVGFEKTPVIRVRWRSYHPVCWEEEISFLKKITSFKYWPSSIFDTGFRKLEEIISLQRSKPSLWQQWIEQLLTGYLVRSKYLTIQIFRTLPPFSKRKK